MTIRFKLVLGLAAMIIALALVGGTAGHQAMSASTHSPYVSALFRTLPSQRRRQDLTGARIAAAVVSKE